MTFTTSGFPILNLQISCTNVSRFGNFIGEAEESEEESDHGANGHDAYVFDDEADNDGVPNYQQLMEIDGSCPSIRREYRR